MRVFVLQLFKRELAATGDEQRFCQQLRRIKTCKALSRAKVTLAVGIKTPAGFYDGHGVADGSEHILELAARTHVHVNVAGGNEWKADLSTERLKFGEALAISALAEKFHGNPHIAGEALRQPLCLARIRLCTGEPEDQAI